MKGHRGAVIIFVVVAVAFIGAGATVAIKGYPQHWQARSDIANLLRDPESAKFRNVFSPESGVVCGEVNGKNGFGGYEGYKRFIWYPLFQTVKIEQRGELELSWKVFCE